MRYYSNSIQNILPIISPKQFKDLSNKNCVILDARTDKNAYQNYLQKHIKDARFIDLDKDLAAIVEDPAFSGRHPLPSIEKFAETLSNLGIAEDPHVVIYDDKKGANAAARTW